MRELKKVDDKDLIVEVELEESKAFTALGNLGRARAALTSARTTANAIYVAPAMQVRLRSKVILSRLLSIFNREFSMRLTRRTSRQLSRTSSKPLKDMIRCRTRPGHSQLSSTCFSARFWLSDHV